jgi:hypothetical protein
MELRSPEHPEPSHIHIPRPSRAARSPVYVWESTGVGGVFDLGLNPLPDTQALDNDLAEGEAA